MANFDPIIVPLKRNNIVEASAGTGKTFSIGLLVLRLLIEKKLPIDKILMVTFTNAAVAELALRIRSFITKALKVTEGEKIEEQDIVTIVEKYGDDDTAGLLKKALTDLDEASIQTIHSFCQDALNTNAVESSQAFGLELQPDVLTIAGEKIRNFWRQNITGLPEELLRETGQIIFENFEAIVRESLGGKTYAFIENGTFKVERFGQEFVDFYNSYQQNRADIIRKIENYKLRSDWKAGILRDAQNFSGYYSILRSSKSTRVTLCDYLFEEDKQKANELFSQQQECCHWLFSMCIQQVAERVHRYLKKNHLITYDDLISKMHKAVVDGKKKDFKNALRKKYDAVFIDEFQDTDKLQYEIYNELFGKDKILFYIGDPKQSIYAWRKADLHTYFQAKENIPKVRHYEMDKNYRSSAAYLEALEEFYSRCPDPFYTESSELDLKYLPVTAHLRSAIGLKKESKELKPLQIFNGETKAKIKLKIPRLVYEILYGGYLLNGEKVKNSDIGILVRTNKEAAQVKGLLANAGIHAITIDDNQVFQDSQVAKSLKHVLQAILNTTEANINKALLNSFTGFDSKKVAEINKENLLDSFRTYREIWARSGVYAMVKGYINDFGVMQHLLGTSEANGLRILTDLTQILELLQETEYRRELKPIGLYEYLGKQIAGELQEGDEYQQRMESDEAAVKIVTIHKAKGLEYPIVIAPFLDLKTNESNFIKTYAYREEGIEGKYKFYCKGLSDNEQEQLAKKQWEQENRRLLYVALTRAKFNCFLFKTSGRYAGTTCLTPFVTDFDLHPGLEELLPLVESEEKTKLPEYWGITKSVEKFRLSDKLHGKLSFSGLSLHAYTSKENAGKPEGYDQFIFKDIPGGTNLGNMLHLLFENIDFTGSTEHHREELEKLLDKFYPHKKEKLTAGFQEMIDQVLDANIQLNQEEIPLREIANAQKLNEMEFDLRTSEVDLVGLNEFEAGDGIEIRCNTQHLAKSGLLNGFIDLFFQYKNKYYILDWKSNYLGDHLDHYAPENMTEAMNEGNYHLQYFIYAMAVKNYLEQRLPDFDYERDFGGVIYVYLRGARTGKKSGIYTNKPTLEQVQKLQSIFYKEEPVI